MFSSIISKVSTRAFLVAGAVGSVGTTLALVSLIEDDSSLLSNNSIMNSSKNNWITSTSYSTALTTTTCEQAATTTTNVPAIGKAKARIVIVGGGTAGVGVAAMCRKEGFKNITLIEPKSIHYYQPLWTLVGSGLKQNTQSVRNMSQMVPSGTEWVQSAVQTFHPEQNRVMLDNGSQVEYDFLVVATGLTIDWDAIPGVKEGLETEGSGVGSVYDYNYSAKTFREFQAQTKSNTNPTMLFTMTPTAIKCAGAPLKIMWVLEDRLRRAGRHADISFWTPAAGLFGIPYYANKLEAIRQERKVDLHAREELIKLDSTKKVAVFRNVDTKNVTSQSYDFIHVTPHMGPPECLARSPLANNDGWMDVDKHSMQSTKYTNVFGLGDCTNTPNSKTAAAVTAQAPVVVHNLERAATTSTSPDSPLVLDGSYDGYASCPLLVGTKRCILAEFKYGGALAETFNYETGKFPWKFIGSEGPMQERFFFFLKNTFFAVAYWNLWPRGYWYGTDGPFKPNVVRDAKK